MPMTPVEEEVYQMLGGLTVRGTTKERTIADSLALPKRSGGVEAVLRRLSMVSYIDIEMVTDIASRLGPSTCARLGWVLERKREEWFVSEEALEHLMGMIGRGPYRFGYVSRGSCFDSRWRLVLQETEETMERWLDE